MTFAKRHEATLNEAARPADAVPYGFDASGCGDELPVPAMQAMMGGEDEVRSRIARIARHVRGLCALPTAERNFATRIERQTHFRFLLTIFTAFASTAFQILPRSFQSCVPHAM